MQYSVHKLRTSTTMMSLLLDSCFIIVGEPEQAACSKRAVQIQLAEVYEFHTGYNSVVLITKVVMQFQKSRLEYVFTFSLLCPWMAVVIHTSRVTCKVQSSKCIHICTAGYTWVPKPDIKCGRIWEKGPYHAKHNLLLLLNLSPFQGHKSPRLPTWFVDSLDLLLHRSNVIS